MATAIEPVSSRSGEASAGSRRRLLLVGLALGLLVAELDGTMFATMLPTLVGDLGGVRHQHWVNTAYVLAGTVTMPVYGQLSDVLGRRRVFLAALAIFLAGSCLGGVAWDMESLIAARVLQGLGGGGLLILIQSVIADVVPARERAPYLSAVGVVFVVAALAGPVLGGWLSQSVDWRWAFWLNVPLAGLAILSAALLLPGARPRGGWERVDVRGSLLLMITITAGVLVASGATRWGWGSPLTVCLATVATLSIGSFLAVERVAVEPVLPLDLFTRRNFTVAMAAGLLIGVAVFGTVSYLPTYLQMVVGLTPIRAGLLMLALIAGVGSATVGSAQLVRRFGSYRALPISGSVVLAVALVLLSTLTAAAPLPLIAVYLLLLGSGLGCAWEVLVVVVQDTVPASRLGAATAANGFFREIGVTLGTALIGLAFTTRLAGLLAARVPALTDPLAGLTPQHLHDLPEPVRSAVVSAYHDAFTPLLLALVPLMIISAVMLGFLRAEPLTTRLVPAGEREGIG